MTINKQLTVLTLLIALFVTIVVGGVFKLAETSRFHQLNTLHLKYVIELRELIAASPNSVPEPTHLRQVVNKIRTQPAECIAMTGPVDHFVMEMIDTEVAIDICRDDVAVADQLLAKLTLYENGEFSEANMEEDLEKCFQNFRKNSILFVEPIQKTVDFIVVSTSSIVVVLSIFVLFVTITMAKTIASMVKKMQKTSAALAVSEEKNRVLAYQDSLTELPNRNALNKTIKKAILRSQHTGINFAVLFIDLDRFKDVNDTRGHEQGDQLLIKMAKRISGVMRDCDSVIRFGGDEFVAIIDYMDSTEELHAIARRIIDTIAKPMMLGDIETHLTGSIGISTYPGCADDAESLLKYADTAMYQAKNKGKNQYLFYQKQFSKQQNRRLKYESQLRHAIEKNQFSLVYQPIVDLRNYQTTGTEALLRWANDDGEFISPEEFIPIAEYSGLIIEIGEWVLLQACQQNKQWQKSGAKNLKIAVNVSGHQLFNSNFPKLVQDVIVKTGLPANNIDLEITESTTGAENARFLNTLNALSEIGVRLLMDDFGTGYSCLSYLRKLPFDVLKIDKSFLIEQDPIASTIIAMGKELDMKVVAEGVETQQSLDFLTRQQCHFAQGYFFQRPVSASELDVFKIYGAAEELIVES